MLFALQTVFEYSLQPKTNGHRTKIFISNKNIIRMNNVVFCTNHRAFKAISAWYVIVRMRPQGNHCTVSMCGSERQLFCTCLLKVLGDCMCWAPPNTTWCQKWDSNPRLHSNKNKFHNPKRTNSIETSTHTHRTRPSCRLHRNVHHRCENKALRFRPPRCSSWSSPSSTQVRNLQATAVGRNNSNLRLQYLMSQNRSIH